MLNKEFTFQNITENGYQELLFKNLSQLQNGFKINGSGRLLVILALFFVILFDICNLDFEIINLILFRI